MATAYALTEMFPAKTDKAQTNRFRFIALGIVAIGASISLLGIDAVSLIVTAQAANGLLLPVIAFFLLFVTNRKSLLGDSTNGLAANMAGGLVILITLMIGLRGIWQAVNTVLGA